MINFSHIHACRSDEIPNVSQSSLPPEKQRTFLVFESALLLLFSSCLFCKSIKTEIEKKLVGSFLRIKQVCKNCKQIRVWESQPFIGEIPAGNIMTSAAILYAGALPSKALRVFKILNCYTITKKTFFRHQSKFLQPAIHSVWTCKQNSLITKFKDERRCLVLAGDGRADSPGHSAKYGSYSLLELTCNKVLDFKLVQVRN